jgi:hypothetical protein
VLFIGPLTWRILKWGKPKRSEKINQVTFIAVDFFGVRLVLAHNTLNTLVQHKVTSNSLNTSWLNREGQRRLSQDSKSHLQYSQPLPALYSFYPVSILN